MLTDPLRDSMHHRHFGHPVLAESLAERIRRHFAAPERVRPVALLADQSIRDGLVAGHAEFLAIESTVQGARAVNGVQLASRHSGFQSVAELRVAHPASVQLRELLCQSVLHDQQASWLTHEPLVT